LGNFKNPFLKKLATFLNQFKKEYLLKKVFGMEIKAFLRKN